MSAERFLELHHSERPLLIPNPWDVGSAKILASLGFKALATTSGGFAASIGRSDGNVSRDEAIAHSAEIVAATELPVSADLEAGYGDDPAEVAETIRLAIGAGLAGCSIEDYSGSELYDAGLAAERIAAAAEAADGKIVLTARAENFLRGNPDLDDTIARLQSFQEAGADVLYAPALTSIEDIRAIVRSVERPVNALAWRGAPTVAELRDAGVARVSIGGGFAYAAYGALVQAAQELREQGTYGYLELAGVGGKATRAAFER